MLKSDSSTINKSEDVSISFFPYLLCAFVLFAILGNLFALKIIILFGLITPAGMVCFPLTFSICNIINDVYGRIAANRAIRTGVVALIFYYCFLTLITNIPPAEIWKFQHEWELIFTPGFRIFVGTILAFYIGEKTNSFILSILKYLFYGQNLISRYLTSTLVGVTVDTVIFNLVAFLFVYSFSDLVHITLTQLLLKYLFEVLGSFVATKISPIIKNKEGLNVIDKFPWLDYVKNKIK